MNDNTEQPKYKLGDIIWYKGDDRYSASVAIISNIWNNFYEFRLINNPGRPGIVLALHNYTSFTEFETNTELLPLDDDRRRKAMITLLYYQP